MASSHIALVLLINVLWGLNFVVSKAGVEHFPPIFFTAGRFCLIAVMLLPWLRWQRGRMRWILAIGLTIGVLHFSLMFTGLSLSGDVSSVAIGAQMSVPFGTILAVLFLGERIGWKRTTAIALAFAGLLVIGFDPVVFAHLDALAMVVGAAFAMALGQVWIARIASTNVFTMNAWIGVIGGPGLLALSLLLESGQAEAVRDAGWLDWSTIAYSAIAASIIGHGGSYFLMRHYPVNLVLAMFLLAPVFGVMFGVLLWGDQLTWKLVVGGACALVGVCVVTLRAGKRPRAPGSPPLTPQNRSA